MKNTYKRLLFVFALAIFSIGAMAQTTPQKVKVNSIRKYSVINVENNHYSWEVQKTTDNGTNWIAAPTEEYAFIDADGNEITDLTNLTDIEGLVNVSIKWKTATPENTKYRVVITEFNHTDLDKDKWCQNSKNQEVEVDANDITVEIESTEAGCTVLDEDSKRTFQVTLRNGGTTLGGNEIWKFKYKIYYNGTVKDGEVEVTASSFTRTSDTEWTFDLIVDDIEVPQRQGQDSYTIKVELTYAEDVFQAPAAIVPGKGEKTITLNKVPAITGGITTD